MKDQVLTDEGGSKLHIIDCGAGMSFAIGMRPERGGRSVGVSAYFEDKLIREFYLTELGALKLADTLKKAVNNE